MYSNKKTGVLPNAASHKDWPIWDHKESLKKREQQEGPQTSPVNTWNN